jgi:large subunit ribosomal protein L7/L12
MSSNVSSNLDKLVVDLSNLTVIEASQLSKMLEEAWGVSAAAPVQSVAVVAGATPAAEQKSSFDVELLPCEDSSKKVGIIKVIREITGLSLLESKTLVDSAPKHVKTGVSKDEADSIKTKLEAAGATIKIS